MRTREEHPNLWAQQSDGLITYGPGPRPYRLPNGDIVRDWTDDQLRSIGFDLVIVDYDDQFDPDVQSMLTPQDSVLADGRVLRTMVYEFQPSARATMLNKINQYVDQEAAGAFDLTPFVYTEHMLVEDETVRANSAANPLPEDYPLLAASIGVNRFDDGRLVETIQDAIDLVFLRASELRNALLNWRLARLSGRASVREAVTDSDAFVAYRATVPAPSGNQPWNL